MKISRRKNALFDLYLSVVSVYVAAYAILFFSFGARLTASILCFCLLGLGGTFLLDRRGQEIAARFAFFLLILLSILSGAWGVEADIGSEYYFLAALVLPYLIFNEANRELPLIASALAPAAWLMAHWGPFSALSDFWILREFMYASFFQTVNFLGSAAIISIFISTYARFADRYRRTHEILLATKSELEEAQAVARMGSWSFDTRTRKITWSKQMYEIFAADPKKGPPLYEQHTRGIHPDDLPTWVSTIDKCCQDGLPFKMRFRNLLPNRTVWVETAGRGKKTSGKVFQLNGTTQDITEILQSEEQMRLERSKSAHRSKLASLGEMAAGIAHEINNPVAVISGAVSLMPRHFGNSEEMTRRLAMIDRACQRIAKIVAGLRKFSRSSDQREFKTIPLGDIVTEAIGLTLPRAQRHGVELSYTCQANPSVECDEIEIEQVVIILINNAVDAVKDLPERWVNVSLSQENGLALLCITDSGKGIAPAVAAKLFEPFFTTKSAASGTGLGLSIAKGILLDHKATIDLTEPRPNTCFEIRFPLTMEAPTSQEAPTRLDNEERNSRGFP